MTVEARKLNFIEEFLKVTDENLLTQMEDLMLNAKKKNHEQHLKPMSMDEFLRMTETAKEEVNAGRVTTHEDLKRGIDSW